MRLGLMLILWGLSVVFGTQAQEPPTAVGTPVVLSGKSYALNGVPMYTQGAPFSLTVRTTRTLLQPDGTTQTHVNTAHEYRDSAGRFRLETGADEGGTFVVRRVTIFDPVALNSISFAPGGHVASLTDAQARGKATPDEEAAARRAPAEPAGSPLGKANEEALEPRTIAGEETFGVRTTTPYEAFGHFPAALRTQEVWTSRGLGMPLLETIEFRNSRFERVVTELTRGEPDAGLFRLPLGYQIKVRTRDENAGNDSAFRMREGVTSPVPLFTPEPEYTEEALSKHISGNVMVSVLVDQNGLPTQLKVIRGLGFGLDEEALRAVNRYRFRPAMLDGKPVTVNMSISVNFQAFPSR